jgi:hypothetical protein
MGKGGMTVGNSHAEGGVKFTVTDTGQRVELEGEEPVVTNRVENDTEPTVRKGTNKEIIDQIQKEHGGKTMDQKVTSVEGGDIVICKNAANDPTERVLEGTDKEILHDINTGAGCNPIYEKGGQFEKSDYRSMPNIKELKKYENRIQYQLKKMEKAGKTPSDDDYWNLLEHSHEVYNYRKDKEKQGWDKIRTMIKPNKYSQGGNLEPKFQFLSNNPKQQARAINALKKLINAGGFKTRYEWIEGMPKGLETGKEKFESKKSKSGYKEMYTIGDRIADYKAEVDYYNYLQGGGESYSDFLVRKEKYDDAEKTKQEKVRLEEKAKRELERQEKAKQKHSQKAQTLIYVHENSLDSILKEYLTPIQDKIKDLESQRQTIAVQDDLAYQQRRLKQIYDMIVNQFHTYRSLYEIVDGTPKQKFNWKKGDKVEVLDYKVVDSERVPFAVQTEIEEVRDNDTFKVQGRESIVNPYMAYDSLYPANSGLSINPNASFEESEYYVEIPDPEEYTLRMEPSTPEELKESLLAAQQKRKPDNIFIEIQANYFNDYVAPDPKKVTDYIRIQKELKLGKKKTGSLNVWLAEANFEAPDSALQFHIKEFIANIAKEDINLYTLLPEEVRKVRFPKRLPVSLNPTNENLAKVMNPFASGDELRPIMMGVYFDKENKAVVATDAHSMLSVHGSPEVSKSSVCLLGKEKEKWQKKMKEPAFAQSIMKDAFPDDKANKEGCFEVDGTFPKWRMVVPTSHTYIKSVDVKLLYTFAKVYGDYLANPTTHQMRFFVLDDEGNKAWYGVNSRFLVKALGAMMELGHDELEMAMTAPSRAIVIFPKGNERKLGYDFETDFALVMPVMLHDGEVTDETPVYDLENNVISTAGDPVKKKERLKSEKDKAEAKDKLAIRKEEEETLIKKAKSEIAKLWKEMKGIKPRKNWKLDDRSDWVLADVPTVEHKRVVKDKTYFVELAVMAEFEDVHGKTFISQYYYVSRLMIMEKGEVDYLDIRDWINARVDDGTLNPDVATDWLKHIDFMFVSYDYDIDKQSEAIDRFTKMVYELDEVIKNEKLLEAKTKKLSKSQLEKVNKFWGLMKKNFIKNNLQSRTLNAKDEQAAFKIVSDFEQSDYKDLFRVKQHRMDDKTVVVSASSELLNMKEDAEIDDISEVIDGLRLLITKENKADIIAVISGLEVLRSTKKKAKGGTLKTNKSKGYKVTPIATPLN